jgi:hypothetical protein
MASLRPRVPREPLQDEQHNVTITSNRSRSSTSRLPSPHLPIRNIAIGVRAGWAPLERLAADARTWHIPVSVVSASPRTLEVLRGASGRCGGQRLLSNPIDLDEGRRAVGELAGLS